MAQSAKYLLCKHEFGSLAPMEKQGIRAFICNSRAEGGVKSGQCWGLNGQSV